MSESKSGFVFLPSYYEAIRVLPDESRLELYDAIVRYGIDGDAPDNLSDTSKAIFLLIRPIIDKSIAKYRASVENGKKGGRPPKKPKENQTIT